MSYVEAAAAAINLLVDPKYRAAVEADFERAAVLARFLTEFPLDQDTQAAPVFEP